MVPIVATRVVVGGGERPISTSGSSSLPHQLWLPSSMLCPKVITTPTSSNPSQQKQPATTEIEMERNGASHTLLSNKNVPAAAAAAPQQGGDIDSSVPQQVDLGCGGGTDVRQSYQSITTATASNSRGGGSNHVGCLVNANRSGEWSFGDTSLRLDNSGNGDAFSACTMQPSPVPQLKDTLCQIAPISLTSPHTTNLALTVNIALLAARDHEQCWVDVDGGIVIGDGFCKGLQCRSVSFEGTHRIKAIGNRMLQGCTAECISFGPMPWVRNVRNGWMSGCVNLRRVDFGSDFISLKRVGDGWLQGCSQLPQTDFSSFISLESVGCGWLEHCISLTSFRLNNLNNLLWIGSRCLARCSHLTTVTFSSMPNLTTVGDGWLSYCPMLKTAEFTHLPRLSVIGALWVAGCPHIALVSLLGTDNICNVGPGWLMWSDGPQVQCTDTERNRIQHMLFESISSVVRVDT